MIPRKLQIKNFLSYGSDIQTIDFSAYKLICLSGKNGHGKSALLDAMTWALWGSARKTLNSVKPDKGLVHLGQTQMFVIFDFEMNGTLYRIRREFLINHGKPYASLDFGILDPETESFSSLTDKKIRKTQQKIESTLHIDFESFANSAFLRQGHANEFSKKSPKDRKQVLATILGLNQYETLRKRAMEKAKFALTETKTLTAFQEKINLELQKKESIQKDILNLDEQLKHIEKRKEAIEKDALKQQKSENKWRDDQKQHEIILFQLNKLNQEKTKLKKEFLNTVLSWRSLHKKQLQMPDKSKIEKQKTETIQLLTRQQKKLQQSLELKEQYLQIKQTEQTFILKFNEAQAKQTQSIHVAIERLTVEKNNLEKEQDSQKKVIIQTKKELDETTKELHDLGKEIKDLSKTIVNTQPTLTQFEKRKASYQYFIARGNQLQQALNVLHRKEQLAHNEQEPSCPLCEQNLSISRKRFLKQKFLQEKQFLHHQLERMKRVIKKLKELLIKQHEHITKIQKTEEKIKELTLKQAQQKNTKIRLEKQALEIQTSLNKIGQLLKEKTTKLTQEKEKQITLEKEQETSLIEHTEYHHIKSKLDAITKQAKEINYSVTDHKKIEQKLQSIEKQIGEYQQLQAEFSLQPERLKQTSNLNKAIKRLKKEMHTLEKKCTKFKDIAQQEQEIKQIKNTIEQTYKTIQKEKEVLAHQKGSLQEQQRKLEQLEKEHKQHEKKLSQLSHTIDDYQTIATATGKDGIQALLIEETIPEIEQEANYLLSKLTNNQAQVFIESLRDLKKGGTKETLDINISDPAGIRPYEMFSGGEAFRIDFALRIAISKLLARRAGTALQTLIIDEGFGSQDEEGLNNIMDAILKIQDDFSKIIIVSHLNALKEQFPVHFVVEKRPSGSKVSVIEHG